MEGFVENQPICRACLKIVEVTTQSFGFIEDATGNLRDMLLCCIPEMDIYVSLNPIICIQCIQALINIYQFKARCINTETIIRTFMKKHHLTDQNQVNLGAVVRDLIEINNFNKQQEEKRRQQIAMEQQTNDFTHGFASPPPSLESQNHLNTQVDEQQNHLSHPIPPLHFLEGSSQNFDRIPTPIREYPQMQHPSFIGPGRPVEFLPHRLGPPPPMRHLAPLRSMGPTRPIFLMSHLDAPPQRISNGFTLPVQLKETPIQQNVEETIANELVISTFSDTSNKGGENSVSDVSQLDSQNIVTTNETIDKTVNNCNREISKNEKTHHIIENERRLIIRIPRCDIRIPYNETKSPYSGEHEMETDDAEEAPMDDTVDPIDEDIQADINEDIPTDYPDYLPVDGNININEIYSKEEKAQHNSITKIYNCTCMYLTTSLHLFEEHKKRCKSSKKNMVKCPHCPHVTNRTYALNKHINTMHTKAVWFHCDSCSYRSTDKSCLRRHVRKNHEERGESETGKQFCCTVCNMMISSVPNFNRHMMKHEESTYATYDCDFCSYSSKDRSNYRKHIFTHSPIQLQCPNCPYSNVSPYQLRTHIKRFHNGAGIEAADCKSEIPISEIVNDLKELLRTEGDLANACS